MDRELKHALIALPMALVVGGVMILVFLGLGWALKRSDSSGKTQQEVVVVVPEKKPTEIKKAEPTKLVPIDVAQTQQNIKTDLAIMKSQMEPAKPQEPPEIVVRKDDKVVITVLDPPPAVIIVEESLSAQLAKLLVEQELELGHGRYMGRFEREGRLRIAKLYADWWQADRAYRYAAWPYNRYSSQEITILYQKSHEKWQEWWHACHELPIQLAAKRIEYAEKIRRLEERLAAPPAVVVPVYVAPMQSAPPIRRASGSGVIF